MSAPDPRPVFAALHNPATRRAYAQVVLGEEPGAELSPSEQRRVRAGLLSSGLVVADGDGWAATGVFGELLAAAARTPRPTDVTRFLTSEGRVDRYPARAGERRELLALLADRVVALDDDLTEAALNERLRQVVDDVPTLRRYLVDHGLLDRAADGSSYRRAASREIGSPDRP